MGWGLDAALERDRRRARLGDRRDRRHPGPPPRPFAASYPRDAAIAEAEAFLDGRAYVTRDQAGETAPKEKLQVASTGASRAPDDESRGAEYYPRGLRTRALRRVGAPAGATRRGPPGADVEVLVLHRPVPSRAALRSRRPAAVLDPLKQPLRTELDGLRVTFVPFVAPPRPRSYPAWGAWAAPPLAVALRLLRRRFPFDLVHAHYAAPAGDAVRRARLGVPLVVSVHGGDVLGLIEQWEGGPAVVQTALGAARLTLANSAGIARRCEALGAREVRVVHLGTDLPAATTHDATTLVTVGNLIARKRHADVLRALWLLRDEYPELRWVIAGDGPERPALERLAAELGLAGRVEFRGALAPDAALATARAGGVFVLPSIDEAFGVSYIEAMAGGIRRSAPAASRGPRRSRPRAAACGSSRRGTPRCSPASCARCSTSPRGAASSAPPRAPTSRRTSPGRRAGAPRSPPTRTRCDEAGACS